MSAPASAPAGVWTFVCFSFAPGHDFLTMCSVLHRDKVVGGCRCSGGLTPFIQIERYLCDMLKLYPTETHHLQVEENSGRHVCDFVEKRVKKQLPCIQVQPAFLTTHATVQFIRRWFDHDKFVARCSKDVDAAFVNAIAGGDGDALLAYGMTSMPFVTGPGHVGRWTAVHDEANGSMTYTTWIGPDEKEEFD